MLIAKSRNDGTVCVEHDRLSFFTRTAVVFFLVNAPFLGAMKSFWSSPEMKVYFLVWAAVNLFILLVTHKKYKIHYLFDESGVALHGLFSKKRMNWEHVQRVYYSFEWFHASQSDFKLYDTSQDWVMVIEGEDGFSIPIEACDNMNLVINYISRYVPPFRLEKLVKRN